MKPILSIVIPAYNEEKRLGLSLRKIMDYLDSRGLQAEIVVVDDGSSDQTAAVAKEILKDWPLARVLVLPKNQGKVQRSGKVSFRLQASSSFFLTPTSPLP